METMLHFHILKLFIRFKENLWKLIKICLNDLDYANGGRGNFTILVVYFFKKVFREGVNNGLSIEIWNLRYLLINGA